MTKKREFASFYEFYPFYVSQHHLRVTRVLHATGSFLGLAVGAKAIMAGPRWQILLFPVLGYSFAWFSHFVIEKNKPATFGYPLHSFRGDWMMIAKMLIGKDGQTQELAADWLRDHPEDRPGSYVVE